MLKIKSGIHSIFILHVAWIYRHLVIINIYRIQISFVVPHYFVKEKVEYCILCVQMCKIIITLQK